VGEGAGVSGGESGESAELSEFAEFACGAAWSPPLETEFRPQVRSQIGVWERGESAETFGDAGERSKDEGRGSKVEAGESWGASEDCVSGEGLGGAVGGTRPQPLCSKGTTMPPAASNFSAADVDDLDLAGSSPARRESSLMAASLLAMRILLTRGCLRPSSTWRLTNKSPSISGSRYARFARTTRASQRRFSMRIKDVRADDGFSLSAPTGDFLLDVGFRPQLRGVDAGGIEGAAGIGPGVGTDAGEAGDDCFAEFAVWLGEHGGNLACFQRRFKSALKPD